MSNQHALTYSLAFHRQPTDKSLFLQPDEDEIWRGSEIVELAKFIWTRASLKISESGKSYKQKKFNKTKSETFGFPKREEIVLLKFSFFFHRAFRVSNEIVNIWVLFSLNRRETISKVYIKLD